MQKAVELYEGIVTKTAKTLEDYIHATIGTLDTLEGLIDGNITTYYYSGVPTIENQPASGWTDSEYESHIDDLYYDKDTGYAYVFFYDHETEGYGWKRTKDAAIIKALAIANAASDTVDGKKRTFTEMPYPPYDNGDLWLSEDGDLYVCQISKGESEVYEENDFIIATKYTDDTVANRVGNELEVLQGTVLTVIEDADFLRVALEDLDTKTSSEIELIKNQLTLKFEETQQHITDVDVDLKEKYNTMSKYFTFGVDGLEIGSGENAIKLVIDNEKISFQKNGSEFGWWDGVDFHTGNIYVEVNERARFGNFAFVPRSDGSLMFLKVGG